MAAISLLQIQGFWNNNKTFFSLVNAPNPNAQKKAQETLDRLFTNPSNVWTIHYSCESFYDRFDGRSPRITSIALMDLENHQTKSFSIHQQAELNKIEFGNIEDNYDSLEKSMLDRFYETVNSEKNRHYLHWNMRDSNYGFPAIEHRYAVLGGTPFIISDKNKTDLARLLKEIYGNNYSNQPHLTEIMKLNSMGVRNYLAGKEEADAFDKKDFISLHQSTLKKVDVISNLANKTHEKKLKTNINWWQYRGGKISSIISMVYESIWVKIVLAILGLIGIQSTWEFIIFLFDKMKT